MSALDIVKPGQHPVQVHVMSNKAPRINADVVKAAYEVYCHIYQPQEEMVTGNCRGGFGLTEIVAFLYARRFPREEWDRRAAEAFRDMQGF